VGATDSHVDLSGSLVRAVPDTHPGNPADLTGQALDGERALSPLAFPAFKGLGESYAAHRVGASVPYSANRFAEIRNTRNTLLIGVSIGLGQKCSFCRHIFSHRGALSPLLGFVECGLCAFISPLTMLAWNLVKI
jgi:hypothetical protein